MTFTLTLEANGMWRAEADPCAFHFVAPDQSHHTRSEGMQCRDIDRAQAVQRLLLLFAAHMIEPLANIAHGKKPELRLPEGPLEGGPLEGDPL